jgi:hypothetical protein
MRLEISMSMQLEPWLSDDKDFVEQIERELDAFEQAELAFRAQERKEREETVKILMTRELSPGDPPTEPLAYH